MIRVWIISKGILNSWTVTKDLMKVKVLVAQSCLTLRDPTGCSPPGSSVHAIL